MRLEYCFAISELLGIRPWEQREMLTAVELLAAVEFVKRAHAEAKGR